MTTRKTGLAAHSSSSPPGLTRWSMLSPRLANLTVLHLCMDCRIKSGNDDVKKLSRGASSAPELCSRQRQEKVLSSKGKAERRKAHCPTNVRDKRGVRTVFPARPPFGAHACGTRHRLLPRWLSSRTGFPAAAANESFARFAKSAAVKHALCGPVLVPVDRGPEAARDQRTSRWPDNNTMITILYTLCNGEASPQEYDR